MSARQMARSPKYLSIYLFMFVLGPSAESYLKSLADVACSTGFVDRGVWLRVEKQFLSCALVRGRGVVFRHYYKSIAKRAGKDYRDGAVVPIE